MIIFFAGKEPNVKTQEMFVNHSASRLFSFYWIEELFGDAERLFVIYDNNEEED